MLGSRGRMERNKRSRIGWVLALTLACAGGEVETPRDDRAEPAERVEVVDDAGRVVTARVPVRRIVSLVPSVTETVVALGAAERLVARTRFDEAPEIAHLPDIGGGLDPSIERIVELRPELVFAWNVRDDRTIGPRLRESGIPVYAAEIQDTTGVFRTITMVGALLGVQERAIGLERTLRDTLRAVAAGSPDGPRPTVFYLVGDRPPMTAGPATFIGQMIAVAGGRVAFPELDERWPIISLESLVDRQPRVIVLPSGPGLPTGDQLERRPGWSRLEALQAGRVVEIPADLMARPGPGLGRAARSLQEALQAVMAEEKAR